MSLFKLNAKPEYNIEKNNYRHIFVPVIFWTMYKINPSISIFSKWNGNYDFAPHIIAILVITISVPKSTPCPYVYIF